jgi:hypothetical protein
MMNPNDPNVLMMEMVAQRLGPGLCNELVFVGGAVAGLLITDSGQPAIRPTDDVDLIVHAAVPADYRRVEAALREKGFVNDLAKDAPICRWRIAGIAVDVMPTLEEILGFTNRWYPLALETAVRTLLPASTSIRLLTAPVFIATKFEAFASRGNADFLFSHDLGDLISVIDGRDELIDECKMGDAELRAYLGHKVRALLGNPAFLDALPGHLPSDAASQARLPELLAKVRELGKMM